MATKSNIEEAIDVLWKTINQLERITEELSKAVTPEYVNQFKNAEVPDAMKQFDKLNATFKKLDEHKETLAALEKKFVELVKSTK